MEMSAIVCIIVYLLLYIYLFLDLGKLSLVNHKPVYVALVFPSSFCLLFPYLVEPSIK
ncbi:uncharacterized protein EV154DRAFT_61138 [Mucor mucedo]|uniref:uncharacterized protein n=1 Tax=Mucor mucedo TaxID=29922 RepID=UPI00221E3945|nr:uncharacterized protein EV154DRAFT_61138 [Mucor mucedo]KAI7877553.1 hypothetical protein EV154DRAFT_61138 [Mucor mucedo]